MQFKIPTIAILWAFIPAAMASLPPTMELLVFQEGRRIGCVNGYGKFVVNTLGCYPFRAQAVAADDDGDDDNSSEENRRLWAAGYGTCSAEAGVLECYEPAGHPSSFRVRTPFLVVVMTIMMMMGGLTDFIPYSLAVRTSSLSGRAPGPRFRPNRSRIPRTERVSISSLATVVVRSFYFRSGESLVRTKRGQGRRGCVVWLVQSPNPSSRVYSIFAYHTTRPN